MSRKYDRNWRAWAAFGFAVLLAVGARAQDTNASIRGVVLDVSGPLAGATVAAVDSESGFHYETKAGPDGSFALQGLRPGKYEIKVFSDAYAEQTKNVQVLLGQDVIVDFVLSPSEVIADDITVVGDSVQLLVETRTSEIATSVTPEQIEKLPQGSRNFLNFAALAPGVRVTENQDEPQKFRSGGADSRQVNVFIDGLSYKNDVLTGGAFAQDASRGNPFPQNAVQEFRVITQNYKAEYEKAAAAVISAVTKSGGNAFHGDLFYFTQDKNLVAQDDFAKARGDKKADYKRQQGGLSFGGPIIQDKLHFFLSVETQDQDRNVTVSRGPDFNNAPANVQAFLATQKTGVLTSPFESRLYFGKLSWQPTAGQTVDFSGNVRDDQEINGFGGQRTLEGAQSFEVGTDAFVLKHQAILGNALNEAAFAYQKLQWNPTALNPSTPHLIYTGILDVGGKDSTQDFLQKKLAFRDDFSLPTTWHGDHLMKTGVSLNHQNYEVNKKQVDNPLFEFGPKERWQFPFQAQIGFGDPGLKFDNNQLGLYLQDDWRIRPNLTLNLGVRWDYESNMLNNDFRTPDALVNALNNGCRSYGQPVGGQTTWCIRDFLDLDRYTTTGSNDRKPYYGAIQPRVGFAWDVRGDAKTVMFGGWGKYIDRIVLNDIFDEAYRQQWSIYRFCFTADGSPNRDCGPAIKWRPEFQSAAGLRALIASGQTSGPEVFLVANDLKPPRSNQWNLGLRQQLGQWLASVSYANVRGYNGLSYFFGDLPPGTTFNDRFGGNVSAPGYGRVFVTSSARKTWYDGVFVTLDKPYTAGSKWALNIAYTYAKAYQTGTDNQSEGIVFGAFDYLNSGSYYKFPGTNDERHRLVVSGTIALPWSFRASSLITLGSGVPFTVFDDSGQQFTVRWNEGRPAKDDFLIPNAFAYRSVDLRLEWDAPVIAQHVKVTLVGEGFNIFNFDNNKDFESFKPHTGTNARFGQPNGQFNTRRFQIGARIGF